VSIATGELRRRLGPLDAVALGLGGMIGTGVFVVPGPVAAVAGRDLLVCLLLAAAVAACNATSAARLAARYPVSGGAYHWGRELLHPVIGSIAGWCFVVGKVASAAAAALTVGLYLDVLVDGAPGVAVTAAVVAVAAVTAANVSGIRRTAAISRALVAGVIAVLLVVCVLGLTAAAPPSGSGAPVADPVPGGLGLAVGAGLFFLAFAGYARIVTLGEEVREPRRTIPMAVAVAFAVSLGVYLLVVATAVRVLGYDGLAGTRTPLADVASAAPASWFLVPLLTLAAVAAALAVALGVQAGISRVLLAMSRTGELPARMSRIHQRRGTPWVADLVVGLVVLGVVILGGVVAAVALSAGTVLVYYAVANAAAARLPGRGGRLVAAAGLLGCLVLAGALLWWGAIA